jgi:amphi-Trp domain-containing protein
VEHQKQQEFEVSQSLSSEEFASRLRRLADVIERGEAITISVGDTTLTVPEEREYSVECEVSSDEVEIEYQVRWRVPPSANSDGDSYREEVPENDAVSEMS